MNIFSRIISISILFIILSSTAQAQSHAESGENNFTLRAHITSGLNYTYESNTMVAGTYKKNSIPLLTGFELVYLKKYGVELSGGYFPVMFYSNVKQYKRTDVTIDASLIAYPVTLLLKYCIGDFSIGAGGSFCILKSNISLTGSDSQSIHNSFGYLAAASYQFDISKNFSLSPRLVFYKIPEVGSSTVSFQIRLSYNLLDY